MRAISGRKRPTARRGGPSSVLATGERLQRGDVDGLRALVPGLGVVADAGALGEGLEALGVDARVVDEEVLARVVRRDEAVTLVVVEPLDGSGGHSWFPPGISVLRSRRVLKRQRLGTLAQLASGWFPTLDERKDSDRPRCAWTPRCRPRRGASGAVPEAHFGSGLRRLRIGPDDHRV